MHRKLVGSIFVLLFSIFPVLGQSSTDVSSEFYSENLYNSLYTTYFEEGSALDLRKLPGCDIEEVCASFQEALREFLFVYGEDLSYSDRAILLNLLEKGALVVSSTEEELVDRELLRRLLLGSSHYSFLSSENSSSSFQSKLCAYSDLLTEEEKSSVCVTRKDFAPANRLQDLLSFTRLDSQRTSLLMFCRQERKYPCYLLMKDARGNFVRTEDGDLWGQESLGYSRKNYPAVRKNGHTPMGVFFVDGVMPNADSSYTFGKFRRLILEFVPEKEISNYLPETHLQQSWWHEGVVADQVGRKYLRIHGTGQKNGNPRKSYYPFVATRGCVAQREGRYPEYGDRLEDQRKLLDQFMIAQNLRVNYENETKIKSLLYVVNIDDKKEAVTRTEILELLRE